MQKLALVLTIALGIAIPSGGVAADPVQKCTIAKIKAAGGPLIGVSGSTRCWSKMRNGSSGRDVVDRSFRNLPQIESTSTSAVVFRRGRAWRPGMLAGTYPHATLDDRVRRRP